jgi:membrane protease YdiL (CAAX protease family)
MFRGRPQRYEFMNPQPFSGRGEEAIALFCTVSWFCAIMVRLSLPEAGDWSLADKLFEASSFVVFAAIPIFGLATRAGERFAKYFLLPRQGLGFQTLLCTLMAAYVTLGEALNLSPQHFPWLEQIDRLAVPVWLPYHFGLNLALFLAGLFVALRLPFVLLTFRQQPFWVAEKHWIRKLQRHSELFVLLALNLLYLCTTHTSLLAHSFGNPVEGLMVGVAYIAICLGMNYPGWKQSGHCLTTFDFWLMVLCAALIYWVSIPSFSFGIFIAVSAFILVLIYGTGLGRVHFGYSFQMRRPDWGLLVMTLAVALIVLGPLALVSGFVQPQRADPGLSKLLSYFVLFTLRVGIFEEVFFRAGIMIFLRDRLLRVAPSRITPAQIVWLSALGCSLLFGLVHIGNSAESSPLGPWLYKALYIGLATTASLFYAILFARSNRLAPAVLIHGFIDTTAVVLLGGFLAVPF